MNRGLAPVLLAAILLAGCSGPSEASKPRPVPAPSPPAAGTVLGRTGPATAGRCHGVPIAAGEDPQQVIDENPAGTTFCFGKGLHRITRPLRPTTGSTLASSAGTVLSGAVPLSGWQRVGPGWVVRGALPAPYGGKGKCEDEQTNPCHLGEQVFVDGRHLTRVTALRQLSPGSFFADYDTNAVYLADDPRGRSVEMSRTATAIKAAAENVTVRGLTVERFASRSQGGAIEVGAGWTVAGNEVRWNHAVGVMVIKGDRSVLSRNTVADNGQLGIGQYSSADVRITANLVARNNTDGFWIADWESGGIKSTRSSGEVSGNDIVDNRGVGMWSDVADHDRRISGNRIRNNAADGIRYEISYQGVIEQNVVQGNGFGTGRGSGPSLWDGGGINVNTSAGVRVVGNQVRGNRNGIAIQSRTRGEGPRGVYVLRDVLVEANEVQLDTRQASTGVVENKDSPTPDDAVRFSRNSYRLDDPAAERFAWRGRAMTWHQWQDAGFDRDSSYS